MACQVSTIFQRLLNWSMSPPPLSIITFQGIEIIAQRLVYKHLRGTANMSPLGSKAMRRASTLAASDGPHQVIDVMSSAMAIESQIPYSLPRITCESADLLYTGCDIKTSSSLTSEPLGKGQTSNIWRASIQILCL